MAANRLASRSEGSSVRGDRTLGWWAGSSLRPIIYGLLIVGALVQVYPIFFLLMNTLKTDTQILNTPFSLPTGFSMAPFIDVWTGDRTGMFFGRYFFNSVIVLGATLVLMLAISCLCGYAMARGHFPGNGTLHQALLLSLAVPAHALAIPLYFFVGSLGLRNSLFGLTLVYAALGAPFTIILMRAYFMHLPLELEEAARIDGCGRLGVFLRIVMPISRGPIAGMAIININWIWSELFFSLILMNKADVRTLPLAIALYKPAPMTVETVLALQYAAMALATIPVLILFFIFQRQIASGMTMGAFK
ncbi:MAG: carbohydrate ABC transporter permease [Caldilineaceae bacterium]|nr:carbohydrate ABC transporter permease [Caldilineaceae bacterium]MDE0340193.1 carbohydrate ABC transporter permease [Caldilineaceae bacterium]